MTLYADNIQSEGESSSSVLLEMMYGYQKSQAFLWQLNWELQIF
jgi:hypothetical protein